ncbi:MAG: hypothetical protein JWQ74_172 [Marmoricola sp.]|nr:hypothetical protein [Marmoricola sp.]
MGRRTAAAAVLGIVLTATSACGASDCVKLRGPGEIKVQVPPAVQKLISTVRVELCQGSHCEAVNFPSRTTDPKGAVAPGVTLADDAYQVALDRLGSSWKPATTSGLTVLGTTRTGRVVVRHTEQFTFDAYIPTADDCDQDPTLTYVTGISGGDLGD